MPTIKQVFYWSLAALAIVALASPYPDMATLFVVILIVGVLLTHASDYLAFFNMSSGTTGG